MTSYRSGAGDGAATFTCSVGVPADESMGSRHKVARLQKNLSLYSPPYFFFVSSGVASGVAGATGICC